MALLTGKKILVTGVLTPGSIAYAIAEASLANGAEVVLTSFGRAMSITQRSARRMATVPDVLEMDVTKGDQVQAVADELKRRWGSVDAVVHAVAYAPPECLGGDFLAVQWSSVAQAMEISAYSLNTLAAHFVPLMPKNGSLLTLTFDATLAWPIYNWMGPTKAALEAIVRYLARHCGENGVRVNAIAAGPLETIAAKSIPGFGELANYWKSQAPLGWDNSDATAVADAALFFLSDLSRAITGAILHVDGGFFSQGAPLSMDSTEKQ